MRENGGSKSYGRCKSLRKSKEKCWNCIKFGHFKRDCKEDKKKNKKENNDFDDVSKTRSQEDGGDAFAATLVTCVS